MGAHWREKYQETGTLSRRNGVHIKTVRHRHKRYTLVKRTIPFDGISSMMRALSLFTTLKELKSDRLVTIYGVDLNADRFAKSRFTELDIYMEYMEKGSFDKIYGRIGYIPIDIVGEVALAVSEALSFMFDDHNVVPRCIKPSNILLSAHGKIKLCDYAMSTEVMNSQPESWVRTSYYTSPERVLGHELDQIKGDVWALGITLIELALGRFPYGRIQPPEADWMPEDGHGESDNADGQSKEDTQAELQLHHESISAAQLGYASPTEDESFAEAQDRKIRPGEKDPPVQPGEKERPIEPGEPTPSGPAWAKQGVTWRGEENTMSIIDLLRVIVYEDAPRLPEGCFVQEAESFVDGCLEKDTEKRMSPSDLVGHAWSTITREKAVDIKAWASSI